MKEQLTPRVSARQAESADVRDASAGRRRLARAGRGVVGLLLLVLVWETAPRLGLVDRYFVPPLSEVLVAWGEMVRSGELTQHVQASLLRSVVGFGLAVAAAVPVGIAIAWYAPVAQLLNPVLEIFRNTAALALLPVFVLVLGIGETSKIAIVTFACFFPVLLNTISGVRSVDPLLVKAARSLGLTPTALFTKVVLPSALPAIFTGVRIAGAAAILVLIAAEMVGATAGLGYLINYAQYNFLVPEMYAGILTISALGLLINQGLVALERRFSYRQG